MNIAIALGFVFWLVDVLGRRLWALPFKIYGMNAIAAFVAAGIVVRVALILKIYDPASQKTVSLLTFCQLRAAEAPRTGSCLRGRTRATCCKRLLSASGAHTRTEW